MLLFVAMLILGAVWRLRSRRDNIGGRNPKGSFDLFFCSESQSWMRSVQPLWRCDEVFSRMLQTIERAKRMVRLEMYIFDDDGLGRRFEQTLSACVNRGVEVHLMCDGYGCRWSRMTLLRRLEKEGAKVTFSAGRLDCRNHRKLLVVDDCVAFVGGVNIARRYVCGWRDVAVEMRGDVARWLGELFDADWHKSPPPINASYLPVFTECDLLALYVWLMRYAVSRVLIITPYLLPSPPLLEAMTEAVRRGVKVRVQIPRWCDNRVMQCANESCLGRLLEMGAEVWMDEGAFNHAKSVVVDDVVVVGSANFDYRSMYRNRELMVAFRSEKLACEFVEEFCGKQQRLHRITLSEWRLRPLRKRTVDRVITPLYPLL